MFCKNCGKDIGDAKFCQYCGNSNDAVTQKKENSSYNELFSTVKDKVKQIGHVKLINLTAIFAAVINVIMRVTYNEIETVYVALAQDDYFVVSESGRKYMIGVIAVQCILTGLLYADGKKQQIDISKKALLLSAVSLGIQIVAMLIRFPAPY